MQAAGALALAACSSLPRELPEDPGRELTAVPFFAQSEYQCGPAALATVLNFNGVPVTPDELTPQVYIPARHGSLQVEMLAATRRADRIPYVIDPAPAALATELAAGRPVLVLQNAMPRSLARLGGRRWHYAVVVGHDPVRDLYVLRSGRERRRLEPAPLFLASWAASDNWGVVVDAPGVIPAGATPERYLRAILDGESTLSAPALDAAYAGLLRRWPDEPLVLFAAANKAYAGERLVQAEDLYRQLLALEPGHVAARNNLANLLLDRGCSEAAVHEAETALAATTLAGTTPAFLENVRATLGKARSASGESGCSSQH